MSNIDEGIFFSDKQTAKTRTYRTEEEAETEKNELMTRYKNRSPKATSKKAKIDKYGKYYFEIQYTKNDKEDEKSIGGRLSKMLDKPKKEQPATKEPEEKPAPAAKEPEVAKRGSVSSAIMINDKVTTRNPSAEKAKLKGMYDKVNILSTEKNSDGSYTIKFERSKTTKKADDTGSKENTKTGYDNDGSIEIVNQLKAKVSNIEKQIRKLMGK
jgi:hypothetical protein